MSENKKKSVFKNELYIAPNGNDLCNGFSMEVDIEKNEGPLATLQGALDTIVILKQSGMLYEPLTVWVRGGVYRVKHNVVIGPEHSGPITFKAFPGETPVFDGGVELKDWEEVRINGVDAWQATVPPETLNVGSVDQLFVNGKRKRRARLPKDGYFTLAACCSNELFANSNQFVMESKDFNSDWYDIKGIEAVFSHYWTEERMPLESAKWQESVVDIKNELPPEWYVLGPCDNDFPVTKDLLHRIPESFELSGKRLTPQKVNVTNGRLDLAPLIGGAKDRRSALVYIPFTTEKERSYTFGFGADWWFDAYLDGTRLCDTLESGNSNHPPTAVDQHRAIHLKAGSHLLAIHFISGAASSVLAVSAGEPEICSHARGVLHSSRGFVFNPTKETDFRLENVREALLDSGEYYFDRCNGTITYVPEEGESPATTAAFVPSQGCALMFNASPEEGESVEGIHFEGLEFQHFGAGQPQYGIYYDFKAECSPMRLYRETRSNIPFPQQKIIYDSPIRNQTLWSDTPRTSGGKPLAGAHQSAVHLPGVIFMRGAKNCVISDCSVSHSGWYAVDVAEGCENIKIERCDFFDLGGGGVKVGGANYEMARKHPRLATSRVMVKNNNIHTCGKIHFSAVGVIITHAFGNLVEHNHIHDIRYSGISCGWVWGYGNSITQENRIGWNKIHNIGQGLTSDLGGIYTLGIQPGTRIYNNLVFDVKGKRYGGCGIYLDEGSSHIVVENNICYDCSETAFNLHFGRENILRHNIFVSAFAAFGLGSGLSHKIGYAFPGENYTRRLISYGNIVFSEEEPFAVYSLLEAREIDSDLNCFWNQTGNFSMIARFCDKREDKISLEAWQREMKHDCSSQFVDPMLEDFEKRDFRLRQDSPLRSASFYSLDLSEAGVMPKE